MRHTTTTHDEHDDDRGPYRGLSLLRAPMRLPRASALLAPLAAALVAGCGEPERGPLLRAVDDVVELRARTRRETEERRRRMEWEWNASPEERAAVEAAEELERRRAARDAGD